MRRNESSFFRRGGEERRPQNGPNRRFRLRRRGDPIRIGVLTPARATGRAAEQEAGVPLAGGFEQTGRRETGPIRLEVLVVAFLDQSIAGPFERVPPTGRPFVLARREGANEDFETLRIPQHLEETDLPGLPPETARFLRRQVFPEQPLDVLVGKRAQPNDEQGGRRDRLQPGAVDASEPIHRPARHPEGREAEPRDSGHDRVQRRAGIPLPGPHLVESIYEERPRLPARNLGESPEVVGGQVRGVRTESLGLPLELGRLAGAGIADEHERRFVSEISQRPGDRLLVPDLRDGAGKTKLHSGATQYPAGTERKSESGVSPGPTRTARARG